MKISIRWTLILGFLCLIWGTQLIITSSTYFSSEKALLRHARDIMQNIADLTMAHSANHLALAHDAAHLTERLMVSEVVGSGRDQLAALEKFFLEQLTLYSHFAGIYIGAPDGDFFYVSRSDVQSPGGFRTKIITHSGNRHEVLLRFRDKGGQWVSEQSDPQDTYDPRQRPWYQKALVQNSIVWTDPYIFFTSQKPGITIAGPIYRDNDQLHAIVGVDIEIDQLSLFIGGLRIGKNGRAFMLNNNGDVVAFPDAGKLKFHDAQQSGKVRLVKIDELDDSTSKAAYNAVDWSFDGAGRIRLSSPRFVRFTHEGEVYHAMFAPFQDEHWPWIIGVFLPESDYLGSIQDNRRFNLLITLMLSVLATFIGLRMARGIIRPLAGLEKEALAIKQRDYTYTQQLGTESAYTEIRETAEAFTRMKEALRAGEEKYRCIFENIQDIYYETSWDGKIIELSPSVQKVSHYTREELIGKSFDGMYENPQARAAFLEVIQKEGKVDDYEIRLRDKHGAVIYCAITAALKRCPDGRPVKIIGSLRMINDRKRTELTLRRYQHRLETLVRERTRDLERTNQQLRHEVEVRKEKEDQLRKSEEKYRSIIENMDNGYYEMDLNGILTFFNNPLAEMTGYAKEEMPGLNYRSYMAADVLEAIRQRFKAIHRTGIPEKLSRFTLIRKDGSSKTVEASASLITDADGKPTGYRGVVLDITERLNAENEKRKLEERVQQIQRLESIGTLAGGVAHDFNNLLMGIQGNISLMLLDVRPDHHHYEKLKNIESCVAGGADLTRQLLGFARGGKYMVKPLDINRIMHKTTGMFGRTRKEIQINENLQKQLWPVMADRSQIEQVLLNLCINAWQAMPEGGTIRLETRNMVLQEDLVRPLGIAPGRYVRISVADDGIGMDEATQQRIFEPFFTTKEIGRGTGLGLASAYGIVKNHGGALDFISRLGEGTTFYIYLPASEVHPTAEAQRSQILPQGAGTVLVVDDEAMILEVSRNMLEKLGYTVLPAPNGKSALEIFERDRENIDLVLLDMIMPDLGGAAVFDRLMQIQPDVKVLLSSGYSLTEEMEELLSRGRAGFIQKPFNFEQLNLKIQEILNG